MRSLGPALATLATLLLWLATGCTDPGETVADPRGLPKKHAVVIVIDTLRADVIDEVATPRLDALAASQKQVDRAWSAGTWTAPSVTSIFSGMHVREHGWDFPFPGDMASRAKSFAKLPKTPLLAQVLREEGFRTTGLWGNPILRHKLGFSRGFETWDYANDRRLGRRVAKLVADWDPADRQFLYLHMFGAHHPVNPSMAARERWHVNPKWFKRAGRGFNIKRAREGQVGAPEHYNLAYRAKVEDIDAMIGEVVDALGPHLNDTVLIITSDHGELLGEHGQFGHDHWVWEQLTYVPFLVVGGPELPGTTTTAAIPDLLTRALGLDRSWSVGLNDGGPIVSQREGKLALSLDGRTKAIWDADAFPEAGEHLGIFDVHLDPAELNPMDLDPAELSAARAAFEGAVPFNKLESRDEAFDEDMLRALEELGYMDDEPAPNGASDEPAPPAADPSAVPSAP